MRIYRPPRTLLVNVVFRAKSFFLLVALKQPYHGMTVLSWHILAIRRKLRKEGSRWALGMRLPFKASESLDGWIFWDEELFMLTVDLMWLLIHSVLHGPVIGGLVHDWECETVFIVAPLAPGSDGWGKATEEGKEATLGLWAWFDLSGKPSNVDFCDVMEFECSSLLKHPFVLEIVSRSCKFFSEELSQASFNSWIILLMIGSCSGESIRRYVNTFFGG